MQNKHFQVQNAEFNLSSAIPGSLNNRSNIPRMDILENENLYIYLLEMPGINSETLSLDLEDNFIIINAVIMEKDDFNYIHNERSHGIYNRQISMPENIDPERIEANYQQGILEIKLSKINE